MKNNENCIKSDINVLSCVLTPIFYTNLELQKVARFKVEYLLNNIYKYHLRI